MRMTGSLDYLDHISPSSDLEEPVCFPLKCWKNFSLSSIWIPSHLLSGKKKAHNSKQVNQGVFHTLDKEDSSKQIESFSVYLDSFEEQNSNVEEIFQSDSDEEILFSSGSNISDENRNSTKQLSGNTLNKTNLLIFEPNNYNENSSRNSYEDVVDTRKDKSVENDKATEKVSMNDLSLQPVAPICSEYDFRENISMKTENNQKVANAENTSDSQISLNEILDTTPSINIKHFSLDFKKKDNVELTNTSVKKKDLGSKRNSKKERQLKKKASKIITLDGYVDDDILQDRGCDAFYKHVMTQKKFKTHGIGVKNRMEFPELVTEEIKFIKSDKSCTEEIPDIGLKSVVDILTQSSEAENDYEKAVPLEDGDSSTVGKIVIENIPMDVSEDDIYSILLGYGDIKVFTLKSTGKCLKASVEMELICDMEWIVDCLNGSEPFGASTGPLKCYNATKSSF